MHIRRTGKLVAGVIAAVAALSLMSLPASANTVAADITAGTLTLRNPSGGTIQAIDLANPGVDCPPAPSSTVTTTNGTAVTGTLASKSAVFINGQHFIITLTITLTGTYTGGPPTYGVSGTTTATAVAQRSSTSGTPCTPLAGSGTCTITASNISWSGTVSAADIHNLTTTETANIAGGNTAFNTVVTGTAANCGTLAALNNGSVIFTGVVISL